jgi:SAM-dependent methyltransferase
VIYGIGDKDGENGDPGKIPERLAKPLGKGFDEVECFLSEYLRPDRDEVNSTPDLGFSLGHVEKIDGIEQILHGIDQNPECLIEGCTSPTNGKALKEFLEKYKKSVEQVTAIDLIDIKGIFDKHKLDMPYTKFRVADATDLKEMYNDASVDVVAQDFLLNCAPFSSQKPIMQEVARVLKPNGIGIICFTDNQCVMQREQVTVEQFEDRYKIKFKDDAFSVSDLLKKNGHTPEITREELLKEMTGKVVVDPAKNRYTLITENGNFEFFQPFSSYQRLLDESGLKMVGQEISSGTDRNGLTCARYRTIIKRGGD